MTDTPLDKSRIIAFLKEQHVDTNNIEKPTRYVYCIGKNQMCDTLAVSIIAGDFDVDGGKKE